MWPLRRSTTLASPGGPVSPAATAGLADLATAGGQPGEQPEEHAPSTTPAALGDAAAGAGAVQAQASPATPAATEVSVVMAVEAGLVGRGGHMRMQYPPRFKAYSGLVFMLAVSWICNYALFVMPTLHKYRNMPCTSNGTQLTSNAGALFMYFIWLVVVRAMLFLPPIAARAAISIRDRSRRLCYIYCAQVLVRDGPLWLFTFGSVLLWFYLLQSPDCDQNVELYEVLCLYANFSCLTSGFCLAFAVWHNRLLAEMARRYSPQQDVTPQGLPPDALQSFETKSYDAELFGEREEGKRYPGECAICLGNWEEAEVIKITPCGHAFHEECLGVWLKTARTCALCRRDLAEAERDAAAAPAAPEAPPG